MAATAVKDEIREAGSDLADLPPEGRSVGHVVVDRAGGAAIRTRDRATGEVEQKGSDLVRI